jgi:eukaryotic-like serine/threonine-protein kinase
MAEDKNLKSCAKCGNALLEGETICAVCKKDKGQEKLKHGGKRGNSVGNILNGGHAVLHDDWIYFTGRYHDSQLQRVKCDGSQLEYINVEHALFLNSVDDWIYYSSGNDQFRVFKIRPDGTDRTQVNDDTSDFYNYLNITDNWLYYNSGNKEEQKICKLRLDGSERTELYQSENEMIYKMGVVGEWVFYSAFEKKNRENRKIYKLHSVSKERTLLVDHTSGHFTLNNEWLYCYDQQNGDRSQWIIKIPIDGIERADFITGYIDFINASDEDGWVYYAKYSEKKHSSGVIRITDSAIYKVRPDGTQETRIIKAPAYNLLIVGDWVIFNVLNAFEDERLCMVRKDGTERQFII